MPAAPLLPADDPARGAPPARVHVGKPEDLFPTPFVGQRVALRSPLSDHKDPLVLLVECPRVKIEKIISLEILELRAENPPIRVVVCHYRFSFWSNSPTRPYGARNGPLRCTMGCVGHISC